MLVPFVIAGALALAQITPVFSIQGRAHVSPFAGTMVTTRGIVTSATPSGFYLQDPAGDGDDATSDGVFIYTGSAPGVLAGDDVEVTGTVVEFLPGSDAENLAVTEIYPTLLRTLARGRPLPIPTLVGGSGRIPPREVIDDDGFSVFDPADDGLDFWESLEGTQVRLVDARVVGPTNAFGEFWVVVRNGFSGMSAHGALTASFRDANPERVQIDDALLSSPMPLFDTGDTTGDIVGVVDYRFGCFEVLPTTPPAASGRGPGPETVALPERGTRLTVATFNVRNLAPDDALRMPLIAQIIVHRLGAPAILALQEIQDSSGRVDDGVAGASATIDTLIAAIRREGGPAYDGREVAPADGADGGAPGGNIRVVVLYDSTRATFVDRGVPSASTGTAVVVADSGVALTVSPGRVDPANPAWDNSRKPLAGEFRVDGVPLFLVVCHFSSRSGTTPEFGAMQPPVDPRADKRLAQAAIVRDFVQSILRVDAGARVVVAGDFNDDIFSGALAPLSSSTALYDLLWKLPEAERYSYMFEGNGHAYDRILVSPSLVSGGAIDVVHVSAGFANAASDHDAVVASVIPRREPARHDSALAIRSIRPNPSAGNTVILVDAPDYLDLVVTIHDVRGRRVRRLPLPGTEEGSFVWDGNDDTGRQVASGVYFVRVQGPSGNAVRRIVRVRARK